MNETQPAQSAQEHDIDRVLSELRGLRYDINQLTLSLAQLSTVVLSPNVANGHIHAFMTPDVRYCNCGAWFDNGVWMTGSRTR